MLEFVCRLCDPTTALLLLAASLCAAYLYATWTHRYWSKLAVPVPSTPVPLFGHVMPSTLGRVHFMDVLRDLYARLGDRSFGGIYNMRTPQLLVKDPTLIGSFRLSVSITGFAATLRPTRDTHTRHTQREREYVNTFRSATDT